MTAEPETWRPVVGYEHAYEVSDLGRVRSVNRFVRALSKTGTEHLRLVQGRILRPMVNAKRGGYRYVNLHRDGQQTLRRVPGLVAAAFIGPRPVGQEVCHDNGTSGDDRLANLRYDTPVQNAADMLAHGTRPRGEKHGRARLSLEDIQNIKSSRAPAIALGDTYGVHHRHINSIRAGRRWAHV